jgi:hypothetical protein
MAEEGSNKQDIKIAMIREEKRGEERREERRQIGLEI